MWTDHVYRQAVKIDFYDRKGELLKTFTLTGFEQFGKYWRPGLIEAQNHQTPTVILDLDRPCFRGQSGSLSFH